MNASERLSIIKETAKTMRSGIENGLDFEGIFNEGMGLLYHKGFSFSAASDVVSGILAAFQATGIQIPE